MSATLPKLLSVEDFWALPEGEGKRELVRGEVVEWMPVGGVHGDVATELSMRLRMWAKQGHHGYVAQEAGYIVRRDPDGVRAADVSYVAKERFLESGIPEKFWSLAPDLAVEVVSPNETADEVQEKVFDYLVAGTPMVWVIYSRTQQVVVHTPDGLARTLRGEDRLEFAQLPGFSCTVAELFG